MGFGEHVARQRRALMRFAAEPTRRPRLAESNACVRRMVEIAIGIKAVVKGHTGTMGTRGARKIRRKREDRPQGTVRKRSARKKSGERVTGIEPA